MRDGTEDTVGLSNEALFSRLHLAYPLIDTSLIQALLSDSDGDREQDVVDGLMDTCEILALQAKLDHAFMQSTTDEDTQSSLTSGGNSTAHDETDTTEASWRSSTSGANSDSPLTFLMTAFPHYPPTLLRDTIATELQNHSGGDDDVDMEAIVQNILSRKYIKELQERGWEEGEAAEAEKLRHRDWSTTASKKKGKKKTKKERDKDAVGTRVFLLGDVQQRQQRPVPGRLNTAQAGSSTSHLDPWTHLSSLASRLSELLPPMLASHFLSLFHSPGSSSPAKALRRELKRLGSQSERSDELATQLLLLKDILSDDDGFLDGDTEMCSRAVDGDVETALELYWLLRDLDRMGPVVSHSPVTRTNTTAPQARSSQNRVTNSIIPSTPTASFSSLPSQRQSSSDNNAWTIVAPRLRPKQTIQTDPLAEFIPAYKNMPAGWRAQSGRASGEPELDEQLPEDQCRYWSKYYETRRDESLREASRCWKKSWAGAKGGDVALVYAEDSREHDRRSKLWALKAARVMVDGRQMSNNARNTVDLHGLTVSEALTLSYEAVNKWWNSSGSDGPPPQSLTLITGRGNHSKGRVGVIGPVVQNALEGEGWRTSKRPGAVLVTGWKRGSRT